MTRTWLKMHSQGAHKFAWHPEMSCEARKLKSISGQNVIVVKQVDIILRFFS